jgi:dipeptidyl aminopeptidase/acylaminoacyl peptidase
MFHYWSDITPISHVYSFQLIWLLSEAVNGAADFNEVHRAARNIRAGNAEDWYREFAKQGDTLKGIADKALEAKHTETASSSLFRAFTYYRSAERVLAGTDKRKIPMYRKAVACFRTALELSSHPHEYVSIPFDGRKLEGIYYGPRKSSGIELPPCVIFLSGADALPEENFFRSVQHITARGMGCLVFNGPGQGSTLRLLDMPTIPDYERPVGAALDYLMTRKDIDHSRIGLLGVSFAGYYGPRAAAHDPRIKALVVWGALYDILNDIYLPYTPLRHQLNWIAGVKNEEEGRQKYAAFTLEGLLKNIRCPVLITHGVGDRMVPLSSAQRTYGELVNVTDKTLRLYDIDEGGAEHCNMDNWSQVIPYQSDWLMDRLSPHS